MAAAGSLSVLHQPSWCCFRCCFVCQIATRSMGRGDADASFRYQLCHGLSPFGLEINDGAESSIQIFKPQRWGTVAFLFLARSTPTFVLGGSHVGPCGLSYGCKRDDRRQEGSVAATKVGSKSRRTCWTVFSVLGRLPDSAELQYEHSKK